MSKNKKYNKLREKGITLIALVITIIVLLILAGVALSALTGDSGILNNAEKAKEKTNLANAKELLELVVQNVLIQGASDGTRGITYSKLDEELKKYTGNYSITGEEEGPWIVTVNEYMIEITKKGIGKIILANKNGTTPWLPTGFSQVTGTTLDTGLTIANTSDGKPGTQNYVWIEVPTTITEEITIEVEGVSKTKTVNLSNTENETEIAAVLEAYVGDYAKGSSAQDRRSWKDEWYDSNGNTLKPDKSNKDDIAGCGMTYGEYQTAYSDMLNSIKTYGGFWLAQYEAGISYEQGNRNSSSDRIETPTSANYAKEQYPYNYVYCSEAQKIANQDSTEEYTSSLPFGIQWDLVCKFLDVKTELNYADIATDSKWGNYTNIGWTSSDDSKYSEDEGESFTAGRKTKNWGSYSLGECLLTTGAIEMTKYQSTEYIANPMNIYDFAGNVWEWTLERANVYAGVPSAFRGGSYICVSSLHRPAAFRDGHYPTHSDNNLGFRSVLY